MNRVRILYVEDDPAQRGPLAKKLRAKGYSVTLAASGQSGLKLLKTRDFDAVLCDLNMPRVSGEKVLRGLRKAGNDIPFIMLTGHGSVKQAVRSLREGADHFILKPAHFNEIKNSIDQLIEKKNLERQLRDSEATLKLVMGNVPDVIYSLNAAGEFISLSPSIKDGLGYRVEELLGRKVFEIIHPEDRASVIEVFRKPATRKKTDALRLRMISKSGKTIHCEVKRTLVFEKGRFVRNDGVVRDVTEQVKLENRLKEYSTDLEKMVEERTSSLEYANRQLLALNTASRRLGRLTSEKDLFDMAPKLLTRTLDFDRAYLCTIVGKKVRIHAFCPGKGPKKPVMDFVSRVNRGKVKLPPHFLESYLDCRTIFIPDVGRDRRWVKDPPFMTKAKSIVISPVTCKGSGGSAAVIVGSMHDHDRDMDGNDVKRFETFVNMVSLTLDNIKVHKGLEEKVRERTESLRHTNRDLKKQARLLEKTRLEIATANIELLGAQEQLQEKNEEQERLLKEISTKRDQLSIILESTDRVILLVDAAGTVQVSNHVTADYFGLGPEKIAGKSFDSFIRKISRLYQDPGKFLELIGHMQKNPDNIHGYGLEKMFERAHPLKGKRKGLLITPFCLSVMGESGKEQSRIWIFVNIADIKKANEQVYAIVNASPVPVMISRVKDDKLIFVNEKLAELAGMSVEGLVGSNARKLFFAGDDEERVLKKLAKDGRLSNYETRLVRADGSHVWVLLSLVTTEVSGEKVYLGGIYDLSQRKKYEEDLKLYREIFMNVQDSIVITDSEGNFRESNPAHRRLTGMTDEQMRKGKAADLIPDSHEEVERQLAKTGSYRSELEFVHSDGTMRYQDLGVFSIKKENGDLLCYAGISRDVTKRKMAEKAMTQRLRYEKALAACTRTILAGGSQEKVLKKALKYLREAAQVSHVYIFGGGLSGPEMDILAQVHEHGEFRCAKDPDAIHQPSPYKDWLERMSGGEAIIGNVRDFKKEIREDLSRMGVYSVLGIPIFVDNEFFGCIGFDDEVQEREWKDVDVSLLKTAAEIIGIYLEQRKYAEAIRVSEERFRGLVENANEIIFSLSPEGVFTYISPTFVKVLGRRVEDHVGKDFFSIVHRDDRADALNWFTTKLEKDLLSEGREMRMLHEDGSIRWIHSRASLIKDEDGRPIDIIGVAHDITEIKRVMEELAEANRHIKDTQSKLVQSEKMASLGMLVAGIAHEINTPIGAVTSMHDTLVRSIERLKKSITPEFIDKLPDAERVRSIIRIVDESNSVIESGTSRVVNIVKRLRSFARLDEAELKTVDIHEGLEDTLMLVHHELKHGITVTRDFGEIPMVACYPGQLNQVFLNIIINASQAMKGEGRIDISTWVEDNMVNIRFRDDGPGISKKNLEKIFDPGFTTKGVGVGTGLGLSICYQIMLDHHGRIKAESEPGQGTVFTVSLPMNLEELIESTCNECGKTSE